MTEKNAPHSVIVLIDGRPSADNRFIKRWFRESRFLTCESSDIFQALEALSDFTTTRRPDVVLLEVDSAAGDFQAVKRLAVTLSGTPELPVFVVSQEEQSGRPGGEFFECDLRRLETRLEQVIPAAAPRHSVAASNRRL